jgi:hypothetical protein
MRLTKEGADGDSRAERFRLLKGDVAGPLPPGASINGETGVFSWLPPVEFSGTFEFVFVRRACSGREKRIPLRVVIEPR